MESGPDTVPDGDGRAGADHPHDEVICNSVAKLDRMNREFSEWPCSLARAVGVFGDSWTLLIVRDGLQGTTRFDEFQRSLNIARNNTVRPARQAGRRRGHDQAVLSGQPAAV